MHTRPDLPVLPAPRRRPWWLAPLCALITGSPFALATGYGVAWVHADDPTRVTGPPAVPEPPVPARTAPPVTAAPTRERTPATTAPAAPTTRRPQPPPVAVVVPTSTHAPSPTPGPTSTPSRPSTTTAPSDSSDPPACTDCAGPSVNGDHRHEQLLLSGPTPQAHPHRP